MIEEQAEVTAVDGDGAWVACRAQLDCPRCAEGRGCGGGLLGRWLGDRLHRVRVSHGGGIRVGDCVVIGLDERALLQAALLVYGAPLGALLGGAVLGHWLGGTDAAALAGAAAGLTGGFAWLHAFSRRLRVSRRFQPAVLRVVSMK